MIESFPSHEYDTNTLLRFPTSFFALQSSTDATQSSAGGGDSSGRAGSFLHVNAICFPSADHDTSRIPWPSGTPVISRTCPAAPPNGSLTSGPISPSASAV